MKRHRLSAGLLAVPFGNCSQILLTVLQRRLEEDYNSQHATRQARTLPILTPFTLDTFFLRSLLFGLLFGWVLSVKFSAVLPRFRIFILYFQEPMRDISSD